jgi:hypothetical protein
MQAFNTILTLFFCHAILSCHANLSCDIMTRDIMTPPLVKHPLLLNRPPSIKQK